MEDDGETAGGSGASSSSQARRPSANFLQQFADASSVVLIPKRNSTSVIWKYFGFEKDDTDQKHVKCKTCMKTVPVSQSHTAVHCS